MCEHITNVCKTAFYYLHNIRHIKNYFIERQLTDVVHTFITGRLDYCNNLLNGHRKEQIAKLQCIQNAAARVNGYWVDYSHKTPVL